MKRLAIGAALTWDGARLPWKALPPQARKFLYAKETMLPSTKKMAELFTANEVDEIRICWVPRLRGGNQVLVESFSPPGGKRIAYRMAKIARLGDILGVIYRR